jgi:hypothetical protein
MLPILKEYSYQNCFPPNGRQSLKDYEYQLGDKRKNIYIEMNGENKEMMRN